MWSNPWVGRSITRVVELPCSDPLTHDQILGVQRPLRALQGKNQARDEGQILVISRQF